MPRSGFSLYSTRTPRATRKLERLSKSRSDGNSLGRPMELTRISTGEKITINKERFVIGRERGRVDYCISDNTAVGRSHAIIVNRGGNAYVIDQNSRNCTYVNDQRAGANQEVKIKSGDKITFADEAFTYNAR